MFNQNFNGRIASRDGLYLMWLAQFDEPYALLHVSLRAFLFDAIWSFLTSGFAKKKKNTKSAGGDVITIQFLVCRILCVRIYPRFWRGQTNWACGYNFPKQIRSAAHLCHILFFFSHTVGLTASVFSCQWLLKLPATSHRLKETISGFVNAFSGLSAQLDVNVCRCFSVRRRKFVRDVFREKFVVEMVRV